MDGGAISGATGFAASRVAQVRLPVAHSHRAVKKAAFGRYFAAQAEQFHQEVSSLTQGRSPVLEQGSPGIGQSSVRKHVHGEIRRSKYITALGAASLVYIGSAAPVLYDVLGLHPLALSVPLTALLLEVVRRSGLRPRIAWDSREEQQRPVGVRPSPAAGQTESREKRFDKTFLVFALVPLAIPLTLWDMAIF